MTPSQRLMDWLETHWVVPAYAGGILAFFAVCFFGAATNTMAGWLYALSGTILALLAVGAILPPRSLRQLKIYRLPVEPVTAGEAIAVGVEIQNRSSIGKSWLQVRDLVPSVLSQPQTTAIEFIAPQESHLWTYYLPTQQRGIYHWHEVELKTGTPLGLFWCRRSNRAPIAAIVYPQILTLRQCPLIDTLGRDDSTRQPSDRRYQSASEGVTKALRDYRFGDPTRLIHWRTSARFDDFKVRELESVTGGQEAIICLDTTTAWDRDCFEAAVVAAATLHSYAGRCQMSVKLWTPQTGIVFGNRVVLETLAGIEPQETASPTELPDRPLVWLSSSPAHIPFLPDGSRWLLFPDDAENAGLGRTERSLPGLVINRDRSLQVQLQSPPRS